MHLAPIRAVERKALLADFLRALDTEGFGGDTDLSIGGRLSLATDNSIYQLLPEAALFPSTGEDINRIVRAAGKMPAGTLALVARGGGTGTNGQSLTRGIVVDMSRHLRGISGFDAAAGHVTVEPGVVLDELNRFLAQHGYFFPPSVSTASRATIGGMVGTDASGKGSRVYGKTSDYIVSMHVVLSNGESLKVAAEDTNGADARRDATGLAGQIHRTVLDSITSHRRLIEETFPPMNRGLTGYNLKNTLGQDGSYNLAYLLAGSEGTLALTRSITLRVLPVPRHRALVSVRYDSFESALRDVPRLLEAEPLAVEIIDDKVLHLARHDAIWPAIERMLGGTTAAPVKGLLFVEFADDDPGTVASAMARLEEILPGSIGRLDHLSTTKPALMSSLWELREKSVGLMGALAGDRRGTAFVEDTAVPPQCLADFVSEFRTILDGHGLSYGMYGHADVGCLHVRPLLDMQQQSDRLLIRPISEAVAALTKRYGGLLWGEHGRGFRAEFSPLFFGPELYQELCRIKAAFDPNNLFNPGKLAQPDAAVPLAPIDAVTMRGALDGQIVSPFRETFDRAIACNGNGACFTLDTAAPMCPSYKATGDRVQSPKGRATLLREWARRQSVGEPSEELDKELHASLSTCLSCKACSTQCPVKVDIPEMKSRFLKHYFTGRRRPFRDLLMAMMEPLAIGAGRLAPISRPLMDSSPGRWFFRKAFGIVDLPSIRPLRRRVSSGSGPRVILVQDVFTSVFDGAAAEAAFDLLTILGFDVAISPLRPSGKAQHVLGFRAAFSRNARRMQALMGQQAAGGVPLVGLEPVALQLHGREYRSTGTAEPGYQVLAIEDFLVGELDDGRLKLEPVPNPASFHLFSHCSEPGFAPRSSSAWTRLFKAAGLTLDPVPAGCCGMAGMFGHEEEHKVMSARIFEQAWHPRLINKPQNSVVATGFSCRCQTERQEGFRPRHPAEALLAHLTTTQGMVTNAQ